MSMREAAFAFQGYGLGIITGVILCAVISEWLNAALFVALVLFVIGAVLDFHSRHG